MLKLAVPPLVKVCAPGWAVMAGGAIIVKVPEFVPAKLPSALLRHKRVSYNTVITPEIIEAKHHEGANDIFNITSVPTFVLKSSITY